MRKEGRKRSGGQGRLWNRRRKIVTTVPTCSPHNPGICDLLSFGCPLFTFAKPNDLCLCHFDSCGDLLLCMI